jgi:GTP-binding protein
MPTVAIVGRPNVGKSTLFNRLIGECVAVVHDEPGVTRDRVYGQVEWNGTVFDLIDTGGYVPDSTDRFERAIREQVSIALEEADLVLCVVDVTVGVTDLDDAIARLLLRSTKPTVVVANKADNQERRWQAADFYSLGFEEVYPVSSTNGTGTGDLLDAVVERLSPDEPGEQDDRPHIAIIGRPNVGKSSLVNALLHEERSIVTEVPGTTRDAVDAVLRWDGEEIVLVDTAGLRRKTRIKENVEFYSSLRSQRAIEQCDVAVLMIDAFEGMKKQDIRVLKMAEEKRKGMVIVVNKWDLVDDPEMVEQYTDWIYGRLQTLRYVPMVFISALREERTEAVLDVAMDVARERDKRISTAKLNRVMQEAIENHHPPTYRGNRIEIKYVTQAQSKPPVFLFFANHPQGLQESYRRYLENQLREHFVFEGVPVIIVFKRK